MPRNGDGSSDNGPIEATHNVAHGVPEGVSLLFSHPAFFCTTQANWQTMQGQKVTDHVDRADKTAPLPEGEKGAGLGDANASGGQSQGVKQGDNVGQGN